MELVLLSKLIENESECQNIWYTITYQNRKMPRNNVYDAMWSIFLNCPSRQPRVSFHPMTEPNFILHGKTQADEHQQLALHLSVASRLQVWMVCWNESLNSWKSLFPTGIRKVWKHVMDSGSFCFGLDINSALSCSWPTVGLQSPVMK